MKTACQVCGRKLASSEALEVHFNSMHADDKDALRSHRNLKLIKNAVLFSLLLGFVMMAYSVSVSAKVFPPIDSRGHTELAPPSHKLKEPMDVRTQRHMIEHSDGSGPPGVIINYNCDFGCEPGLIENLESFADSYRHVYVAPFPKMDAKIVLTRRGRMEILEEFSEQKISQFILGLNRVSN